MLTWSLQLLKKPDKGSLNFNPLLRHRWLFMCDRKEGQALIFSLSVFNREAVNPASVAPEHIKEGQQPGSGWHAAQDSCAVASQSAQPLLLVLDCPDWHHVPWAFAYRVSRKETRNGVMSPAISFFGGEGQSPGLCAGSVSVLLLSSILCSDASSSNQHHWEILFLGRCWAQPKGFCGPRSQIWCLVQVNLNHW